MHWILVPEPPVPRLSLPIVEDLISSQEFISSENPIDWMKQKLMINEQQIQQIASLTIGQKDNCLWSSVRKNRLTASNFGCVLAAIKRNRYPISLYKRLRSAYDLSKKDAIIWGMCNEKIAIEKYKTFGDAVVEPTGGFTKMGFLDQAQMESYVNLRCLDIVIKIQLLRTCFSYITFDQKYWR